MTKRFIAICLAALFVLPGISYAQEKTIPKVEFSVGGGFGIGGYVTTFPTSPWMDYVGQSELENNMLFYTPKTKLQPAGHAGLYVDFNFNEHWGLITGAEFGLYYTKYYSENMLNVKPLIVEMVNNYGGQLGGSEGKHEIWVGSNLANLQENHKMFAVQVPIMAKYMTPISKEKGHQYYVAAG